MVPPDLPKDKSAKKYKEGGKVAGSVVRRLKRLWELR